MNTKIIVAFDLYGTLLSTDSIAKELAKHLGQDNATKVATLWRRYQLEYTWRLNSMDQYLDFQQVTANALQQALAENNTSLSSDATEGVMKAYDSLSAFPDVTPCLKALAAADDIESVIFSNGTTSMVSGSVEASQDLGPVKQVFSQIVTVEEPRCYKPKPEVYYHLAGKVGKSKDPSGLKNIWLVSGNPFDIVGARTVGMKAIWVNRGDSSWTDHLLGTQDEGRPTAIVTSLEHVMDVVRQNS